MNTLGSVMIHDLVEQIIIIPFRILRLLHLPFNILATISILVCNIYSVEKRTWPFLTDGPFQVERTD